MSIEQQSKLARRRITTRGLFFFFFSFCRFGDGQLFFFLSLFLHSIIPFMMNKLLREFFVKYLINVPSGGQSSHAPSHHQGQTRLLYGFKEKKKQTVTPDDPFDWALYHLSCRLTHLLCSAILGPVIHAHQTVKEMALITIIIHYSIAACRRSHLYTLYTRV